MKYESHYKTSLQNFIDNILIDFYCDFPYVKMSFMIMLNHIGHTKLMDDLIPWRLRWVEVLMEVLDMCTSHLSWLVITNCHFYYY